MQGQYISMSISFTVLFVSHTFLHPFQNYFLHWRGVRSATLHALSAMGFHLDGKSRDVDIANLSGSVGGAVGGILTVVGLALIPFTFGASIALTATGIGLGVAGGVTSGGAVITDITVNCKSRKDFDNLIAIDCEATAQMQSRLSALQDVAARFTTWTSNIPGCAVPDEVMHFLRIAKALVGVGLGINSGIKNVVMASKIVGAAVESATEGVSLGKTGGVGAKAASAGVRTVSGAAVGLAAVGLAVDVAMIGYLSHRIHTGSKSSRAAEIRRISRTLQQELDTLQDISNALMAQ